MDMLLPLLLTVLALQVVQCDMLQNLIKQDGMLVNDSSSRDYSHSLKYLQVPLNRVRRGVFSFIGNVIGGVVGGFGSLIGDIVCLFTCKSNSGGGIQLPPPNKPPTIDCPRVLTQHPATGRSTIVTWSEPTANDHEDGSITPTLLGPPSGSLFEDTVHYIQYRATDSGGLSATCQIVFQVKPFTCPSLYYPRRGHMSCTDRDVSGSICSIRCNDGYTADGPSSVTCNTENWSSALAECKATSCGAYPQVEHAYVTCLGPPTFNTYCIVICHDGYKPVGSMMSKCQAHGAWIITGECQDDERPEFTYGCPDDIVKYANTKNSPVVVTWEDPIATDNSGSTVEFSHNPLKGSEFDVGDTRVTITATDPHKNEVSCRFKVTVNGQYCTEPALADTRLRYTCPDGYGFGYQCSVFCHSNYPLLGSDTIFCTRDDTTNPPTVSWEVPQDGVESSCRVNLCPALDLPLNGALVCDRWQNGPMCIMTCNENWDVSRKVAAQYTCGEQSGIWYPNDIVYHCSRKRTSNSMNLASEYYYYSGSCSDETTRLDIAQNFIHILNTSSVFEGICGVTVPECRVEYVDVQCGPESRRRRDISKSDKSQIDVHKRKRDATVAFAISINIIYPFALENNETFIAARTRVENKLNELVNLIDTMTTNGDFNQPDLDLVTRFDSLRPSQAEFVCTESGTLPSYDTGTCRGCPQGTYTDGSGAATDGSDCLDCSIGTHATEESPNTCTTCPDGKSTLTTGATTLALCIDKCPLGSWSSTGMVPCTPCSPGRYQDEMGSHSCKICSAITTTSGIGSHAISECTPFDLKVDSLKNIEFGVLTADLSSVTLSFWVKMRSNDEHILIESSDSQLKLSLSDKVVINIDGTDYNTNISPEINKWTHMALTINGGSKEVLFYLDGLLKFSKSGATLNSPVLTQTTKLSTTAGASALLFSDIIVFGRVAAPSDITTLAGASGQEHTGLAYTFLSSGQTLIVPSMCDVSDDCADSPCGTHKCIDQGNHFTCVCKSGWSGSTCSTPPNYCADHDCQNSATCENRNANYTCTCTNGFRGGLCEEAIVNGQWGAWLGLSTCTKSCGRGMQSRSRECNEPLPDDDGEDCVGYKVEVRACNDHPCPVCPQFRLSLKNKKNCTEFADGSMTCTVSCSGDYVFTFKPLDEYKCDSTTDFLWNHQGLDPKARPPACTKATGVKKWELQHTVEYPSLPCQTGVDNSDRITSQYWGSLSNTQCVKDNICHITTEVKSCDSQRAKRSTSGTVATITITTVVPESATLDLALYEATNIVSPGLLEYITLLLKTELTIQDIVNNSDTLLALNIGGSTYIVDLNTMLTSVVSTCPIGSYPTEGACGDCPPGTFADDSKCMPCNKGTYQESSGSDTCDECPPGQTTIGIASEFASDCKNTVGSGNGGYGGNNDLRKGGSTIIIVCSIIGGAVLLAIIGLVLFLYKGKKLSRSQSFVRISPDSRPTSPPPPYTSTRGSIFITSHEGSLQTFQNTEFYLDEKPRAPMTTDYSKKPLTNVE